MDAIECIRTRRSVRKFTGEKVPVEVVRDIVELASYAPSWKNTQVIRYILVEDENMIQKIADEAVMDFPLNQKTIQLHLIFALFIMEKSINMVLNTIQLVFTVNIFTSMNQFAEL